MAHKDVHFEVEDGSGRNRDFKSFKEAAAFALVMAASGRRTFLDVIVWSRAGARAWGGDDAVERYKEDPEASVFERLEIRVNNMGRVP